MKRAVLAWVVSVIALVAFSVGLIAGVVALWRSCP